MRQTSQAVVLLLGAAAGSAISPDFEKTVQGLATPATRANQGLMRLDKPLNPVYQADYTYVDTNTVAAATANTHQSAVGTTSCTDCIRGRTSNAADKETVWCSAGWNYEYITLGVNDGYPNSDTAGSTSAWDVAGAAAAGSSGTGKNGDLGFCCYEAGVFNTEAKKPTSGPPTFDLQKLNKWTCPAKFTGDWPASNAAYDVASAITTMAHSTNNWWCSDGTYNLTNSDAYGTEGAAAASNVADPSVFAASGVVGALILKADRALTDKRLDLFLAACRQKKSICGAGHVAEGGDDASRARTIVKDANSFSSSEKCTWVMRSKTKAPTFSITNATAGKQLSTEYDIIYSEWVEGWQLTAGTDFLTGYKSDGTTAYQQGGIPIPAMGDDKYLKAYKHNYANGGEWSSTNVQVPGEAFTYVMQGVDACKTADSTFNSSPDVPSGCWNTNMQKRWFSLDPSGAQYQNGVTKNYNTLLSSFNSEATKYNAYLAKVKENAEVDAFAAFFSPPEKPAVVTRPAAPTKPAAYAGMAHWPVAAQQNWRMKNGGSSNDPTPGTHYILGNNQMGGWGAWTISRIKGAYPDAITNKISHSFGLLGTTQGTALDTGRSYLKNWQKDAGLANDLSGNRITGQYLGTSTADNWAGTQTGSVMCGTADLTTATHACGWASGTKTVANTKYVYLNVSVWSNAAQTAANWSSGAVDMKVQFYASAWADGTDYYSPAAVSDPTALTTPAAAQALAASAAAVVAVAAALY